MSPPSSPVLTSHSRKFLKFQLFYSWSHIVISARAHQQVQAWAMPSSLTSVPLMASHLSSRPRLRWYRGYPRWRRSRPSPWYGHHPDGAQAEGYWFGWEGVRRNGRSFGSNSLVDKAKKEEIVRGPSAIPLSAFSNRRPFQGNCGEDFEAADHRRQRCPQSGLE